jgi:hypothetical protein
MASKNVFRNAYVSVNGTDLSSSVRSVTVTSTRPEIDVTSMGDAFQSFLGGIPDATIEVEFFNSYDPAKTDAVNWPLVNSDTPFVVGVRPVNAARSSTNPEYQLSQALLLGDYNPISGNVGEAGMTTVTYRNAGSTGLSRLTA